jgi:hypothetical protein
MADSVLIGSAILQHAVGHSRWTAATQDQDDVIYAGEFESLSEASASCWRANLVRLL